MGGDSAVVPFSFSFLNSILLSHILRDILGSFNPPLSHICLGLHSLSGVGRKAGILSPLVCVTVAGVALEPFYRPAMAGLGWPGLTPGRLWPSWWRDEE